MAVLVSKQTANIGDANAWYRAEAYNFSDISTTMLTLSTRRYVDVTFANSGNCLGVVLSFSTNSSSLRSYSNWYGVLAVLQQNLGTCTCPVASPGVVTKTGHGYTGAKTVTITTGTPGVINYTAHGLTLDLRVGFTTTGAFTGITAGTIYYVVPIDANSFSVAAYPGGPALAISAATGTISMWDEWCEFSTTGALPTGITTTGGPYCVKYIDANTFNVSATAGGTNINFTGSTSGTHSLWTHRRAKGLTAANITNSSSYVRGTYVRGFDIDAYAINTSTSTWRFSANSYTIGSSSLSWSLRTSNGTAPFYVTWCDTTLTYSNTNDAIVIRSDQGHVITINQSIQPKPYLGTGVTTYAYHAIICSSVTPTIANIASFVWENPPSSSYTYTMDGYCKIAADAAFRCGTAASPIPFAQKARIVCLRTPSAGSTAGYSGFGDGSYVTSGSYYWDRANLFLYGEVPTVKWCRLVSSANTGQKDLVCDDVTGFNNGEVLFVGRENTASYSLTSTESNNTIASIASNTITMTSNLTGYQRLGRTSVGTCTFSIASPGVVTLTAHGLWDNEEVCFTTTGSLPTGITANTGYYYVHKIDADTFHLRPSRGSTSYINTSGSDSGTHTCLRAGAHVIRYTGYGIEAECDGTASGIYVTWAFHSPRNIQYKGVRIQNIYNYFYAAGAYSVPLYDAADQEQWLTEDCFFLQYARGGSNTAFAGMSPHPTLGWLLNRCVFMMCSIGITTTFVNNSLTLDVGTRAVKAGPLTATNNYFAKGSNYLAPTNGVGGTGTLENNYFDNNQFGASVQGNKTTKIRYNYSYGATGGTYLLGGVEIPRSNHTQNVYDRCASALYLNATISVGCAEYANVYNPTTAGSQHFITGAGGYFLGDKGYIVDSPNITFSTFDSLFFSYLADFIPVSKIRIANNGQVPNNNFVLTPEGFWRSTGDGLADTTVHSTGSDKFAFRCDPLNIAYRRAEKISSLPIGNCAGKTITAGVWVNIYSSNFYAGSYQLPRLTVEYDNGSTAYVEALPQIGWQYITVSFTLSTSFSRLTFTLSAQTDAAFASTTTPGDSTVYFDDFSCPPPVDRPPVNLGGFDLWADAEPIEPWMATPIFSPSDVWAADPSTFGAGTVGAWVNKLLSVGKFLGLK